MRQYVQKLTSRRKKKRWIKMLIIGMIVLKDLSFFRLVLGLAHHLNSDVW